MPELDDYIPITHHLVLKSEDQFIGPFPPDESLVRQWAETNGFAVDDIEEMGQPWRGHWFLADYGVTDCLPGDKEIMVRTNEGNLVGPFMASLVDQWVGRLFPNGAADCSERLDLYHPYFLEKKPIR